MIPIYQDQIKYNIRALKRVAKDILYIVIHYTANYARGADDRMHEKYFDSANHDASADVFIDEDSVSKVNDWYNYNTWAVGDGKGRYGITNQNSISIEICVNGNIQKAVENTIWYLRNYLLKEFPHIDYNHLVRHYDASRKLCPIWMVDLTIPQPDPDWIAFKNAVFAKEIVTPVNLNWNQILDKEASNANEWKDIINNGFFIIANGDTSGYLKLVEKRNVLKYIGELLVKVDDNRSDWHEILKADTSSPKVWDEVITGCIDFGKDYKWSGLDKLEKNKNSLAYFGSLIEKVDK
jgi:N-acetylmuramoyl-L-alanine amidase CwlA